MPPCFWNKVDTHERYCYSPVLWHNHILHTPFSGAAANPCNSTFYIFWKEVSPGILGHLFPWWIVTKLGIFPEIFWSHDNLCAQSDCNRIFGLTITGLKPKILVIWEKITRIVILTRWGSSSMWIENPLKTNNA